MLVIGLTGGIASGKSTVADLFAKFGAPIIDADVIARDLVKPHSIILKDITEHFGTSILHEDGSLDRRKLRQAIFQNDNERKWLESLLHPIIIQHIKQKLQQVNAAYCIVVIPLLIETGPYSFIDRVLVVHSSESAQMTRVIKRDKVEEHLAQRMIKSQTDAQTRLNKANDNIDNSGDLITLSEQVEKLHQQYLKLAKNL